VSWRLRPAVSRSGFTFGEQTFGRTRLMRWPSSFTFGALGSWSCETNREVSDRKKQERERKWIHLRCGSRSPTLVFYLSSIHLFGYVKVNERPTKWMVTEGEWKIKDEAEVSRRGDLRSNKRRGGSWMKSLVYCRFKPRLHLALQTSSTKGRQRFNPNQRLDVDHRRLNLWRSLETFAFFFHFQRLINL
jgi:hypothetical protein